MSLFILNVITGNTKKLTNFKKCKKIFKVEYLDQFLSIKHYKTESVCLMDDLFRTKFDSERINGLLNVIFETEEEYKTDYIDKIIKKYNGLYFKNKIRNKIAHYGEAGENCIALEVKRNAFREGQYKIVLKYNTHKRDDEFIFQNISKESINLAIRYFSLKFELVKINESLYFSKNIKSIKIETNIKANNRTLIMDFGEYKFCESLWDIVRPEWDSIVEISKHFNIRIDDDDNIYSDEFDYVVYTDNSYYLYRGKAKGSSNVLRIDSPLAFFNTVKILNSEEFIQLKLFNTALYLRKDKIFYLITKKKSSIFINDISIDENIDYFLDRLSEKISEEEMDNLKLLVEVI